MVGVFDTINRVVDIAGTEVDGVQRFRAGQLSPLQVLVVTDSVGDVLTPCKVKVCFSLLKRSDGILPIPAGYEVAARKTDSRNTALLNSIDKVMPQTFAVSGRVFRIVHTAVYHVTDGL